MKYHEMLVNVEDRNHEDPTFEIPQFCNRTSIQKGDYVKVVFNIGERIWLEVTDVGKSAFQGVIINHPVSDKIRFNEKVVFGTEHICDIAAPR